MPTLFSQAVATKAALIKVFTNNQGASGMLSSVKSIGSTGLNETGVYPYIGVDLIQIQKPEFVSIHKLRSCMEFGISISCMSPNLLLDAYAQRDSIIDDGAGNGVWQILREQYFLLLGGLIEKCDLGQVVLLANTETDKAAASTVFYADALIVFYAYATVNI